MNKKGINPKKIIGITGAIGIILLCIYFFTLYHSIEKSRLSMTEDTKDLILKETEISSIEATFHFQGDEAYDIVYGVDQEGNEWMYFNPTNNTDTSKLIKHKMDQLFSQAEIEKNWQDNCVGCTLKRSQPAMMEDEPLWELTYKDQTNGYVMEYFSLEDGSTFEKLRLYRKYNKKG